MQGSSFKLTKLTRYFWYKRKWKKNLKWTQHKTTTYKFSDSYFNWFPVFFQWNLVPCIMHKTSTTIDRKNNICSEKMKERRQKNRPNGSSTTAENSSRFSKNTSSSIERVSGNRQLHRPLHHLPALFCQLLITVAHFILLWKQRIDVYTDSVSYALLRYQDELQWTELVVGLYDFEESNFIIFSKWVYTTIN